MVQHPVARVLQKFINLHRTLILYFYIFCRYMFRPRKTVVGLEQGPLSLVSTTEELLERKVAAPV
jgi:hypothetical protein